MTDRETQQLLTLFGRKGFPTSPQLLSPAQAFEMQNTLTSQLHDLYVAATGDDLLRFSSNLMALSRTIRMTALRAGLTIEDLIEAQEGTEPREALVEALRDAGWQPPEPT